MNRKCFTVLLTMALMLFAFSTKAMANSIEYQDEGLGMTMEMTVEELNALANPSGEWQGNIWVEGDTLYYAERFSGKAYFWKAWILRTADRRFYWDDYYKQWTSVARINFGVVDGYEKQYPLNKTELDCPNQFEYKEYAAHPTSFAKRFGFKLKSKYLYALMEMGDVILGKQLLFKPWQKYIKDKKGKKVAYALDINLHETTTELWTECGEVTPDPFCGDTKCNGNENWQTSAKDCPAPVCNEDGDCDAGETKANCPSDCKCNNNNTCEAGETYELCPLDNCDQGEGECPLIEIISNVAYLQDGFKLNGQLDADSPWYNQLPDSQNRVYLDCDYVGEILEFSTCYESEPGCAAPCPDSPYYYEQNPGHPENNHYRYVCK